MSRFVGRATELRELWEWCFDDDIKRWVLVGDGGKGKSSVAYRFAADVRHTAAQRLGLTGVFWLSAKRRRFEKGSVHTISVPDFWDLDSAINRILADYGWSEFLTKSLEAKRLTALQLLQELPFLLIIDDLDSLEKTEETATDFFIIDAPRTASKVLITSRRDLTGMGHCSR